MMHREYDRPKAYDRTKKIEDWEGLHGGIQDEFGFMKPEPKPAPDAEPFVPSEKNVDTHPTHLYRSTFKGQELMPEERREYVKAQRKKARLEGMQIKAKQKAEALIAPRSLAEEAAALIEKIMKVESELNAHVPVSRLHGEIEDIMRSLDAMGAVIPQQERFMGMPLAEHLNNQKDVTIGEFFAGALHIYREDILPLLVSEEAKTGREALDLHARQLQNLINGWDYESEERAAIQNEGSLSDQQEAA